MPPGVAGGALTLTFATAQHRCLWHSIALLGETTASGSSAVEQSSFWTFFKHSDAAVPVGTDVHLVISNYATHKMPRTNPGLVCRPHQHRPAGSTRLRRCAQATREQLQRGVHRSTAESKADVRAGSEVHYKRRNPAAGLDLPTRRSSLSNASVSRQ